MTWRDIAGEALVSVATHRLRSALASLGVLAGVASVVAASAISAGAERQAMTDIAALGIDNLVVAAGDDKGTAPLLRQEDAATLARVFPRAAVAWLRAAADTIERPSGNVVVTVAGVTATWRRTSNLQIERGRWFRDQEPGAVAVIDASLSRLIFGEANPLGARLLAAGEWRTVIGVLGSRAPAANAPVHALNLARTIFVPFEAMDVALGAGDDGTAIAQIVVGLVPGSDMTAAAAAARSALAAQHDEAAFDVIVPRELLRARLRAQRTFDAIMYAVGALALIVSGFGIANIMLASVSERTAEIGVRRAIGARRATILRQFAAEALVMAAAGGAAGVVAGIGGASAVAAVASWPVAVTPGSVIVSLALAVSVGLAAGTYPAHQAASITPIEALRQ